MTLPAVILMKPVLPEPERLAEIGIRVALTLVVAFLVQRLLFLLVGRVQKWVVRAGHGVPHAEARARTLGQILRSLCTAVVVVGAMIHGLAVMGWNVAPLLAGAGILGVALGFGAQTLVRDVIAGLFILAEDQFAVGDLIEFEGKPATVEGLTVRSTTLRDFNGFVHFVPNGEMKVVVNRSRGWTRLAVDVPVATDQSLDRALEVCRRVVDAMNADPEWCARLLDPIELWGIESLAAREAQLRMVVRARPGADASEVARRLRMLAHRALVEAGLRSSVSREIAIAPVGAGTAGAGRVPPGAVAS